MRLMLKDEPIFVAILIITVLESGSVVAVVLNLVVTICK